MFEFAHPGQWNRLEALQADAERGPRSVKNGLLEKAEQGHWPTEAPAGYLDNRATHRIDVGPTPGSLVTAVFELYASGQHSPKSVARRA